MSLKTVIILAQQQSDTLESIGAGMSGFRADLTVSKASNINSKIFILQREVLSVGSQSEEDDEPYEDTFYSVATPAQMELVPEAPTTDITFYRVSTISLVFETLEEMQKGLEAILALVESLRLANDRVINLVDEAVVAFPPESMARFWGLSEETTISDEILLEGSYDTEHSRVFDKVIPNSAGPRYIYFAYPADLDEVESVKVNGTDKAVTLVSREVETVDECDVDYHVYRTTSTVTGTSFILEVS